MRHALVTLLALTFTLAACAPVPLAAATATTTAAPTATSAPNATNAASPTPTLSPVDIAQGLGLDLSPSYRVIINDYDVTCLENTADGSCVAVYDEKDKAWYKVQHWDDPELLASLKSDFEAKMGMTVEDYYKKMLEEKKVSKGGPESYFDEKRRYVVVGCNGVGLGTRIVEADNVKYLIQYVARGGGDEVKIYPINIAFEGKEGFVQTTMESIGYNTSPALYAYENPLKYSSLDELKKDIDNVAIGVKVEFSLLVRFSDLSSCSLPENGSNGVDVSSKYWQYVGNLCRTSGNYINTESQEPVVNDGYGDRAQDYSINHMLEQGVPNGGLIPLVVGFTTLP